MQNTITAQTIAEYAIEKAFYYAAENDISKREILEALIAKIKKELESK